MKTLIVLFSSYLLNSVTLTGTTKAYLIQPNTRGAKDTVPGSTEKAIGGYHPFLFIKDINGNDSLIYTGQKPPVIFVDREKQLPEITQFLKADETIAVSIRDTILTTCDDKKISIRAIFITTKSGIGKRIKSINE